MNDKKTLFDRPIPEEKISQFSELGMWLKGLNTFFNIDNHSLSEEKRNRLASKNFLEETRVLKAVSIRIKKLLSSILGEKKSNMIKFLNYIEHNLTKHTEIEEHNRNKFELDDFTSAFNRLHTTMTDIAQIIGELQKLGNISNRTFDSLGSIVRREVVKNPEIHPLIDHSFVPEYDRIKNEKIVNTVKNIEDKTLRLAVARMFLEFFRLLRYLKCVDIDIEGESDPKKYGIVIFTLIHSEAEALRKFIENHLLNELSSYEELKDILEATVFSMDMEMKKVYNFELIDVLSLEESSFIYAKFENSKGILKEHFQQSVVNLVSYFEEDISGADVFKDYITKLEQSKKLLESLEKLLDEVRRYQETQSDIDSLMDEALKFKESSLKYLMYKDWQNFEDFIDNVITTMSDNKLEKVLSDFEAYLEAILKEVKKRNVLQNMEEI